MLTLENYNPQNFKPSRFVKEGLTIELNGQTVTYKTVAEDNVFYDKTGKPVASIYSYSYIRTDVEDTTNRPVLFGYNGGPGSSSLHVHAGFLGTRRVKYDDECVDRPTSLGPYEIIDNTDCLLDIADIVCVDPVATGYGVLLDETQGDKFFGIEQDAEALLQFIEGWLNRNNRWLSPKYLVGESYGCTRNAIAAGIATSGSKDRSYSIAFDGLVMIGNTVTNGKYFGINMQVEESVLMFPTWAAVNWYHNHPSDQTLEEFVKEAKEFADEKYLIALYKGESLKGQERVDLINKVCYYTGVSYEYVEAHALRIEENSYRLEVLRKQNKSVARYDARYTRPRYMPEEVEKTVGIRDDASADRYGYYYYAAVTGDIFPMMGIKLDRAYVPSARMWDMKTRKPLWNHEESMGITCEQLRNAMNKTFGMRTFFANGYYDTCTYTGYIDYLMNHSGLPTDRICRRHYPSGHMIYFGEANVHALCSDIREFVLGGMPQDK